MEEFISWLWNLTYWHWFGLGVLFLTFEIILPTNVLVFPAISAILLGGLITLYPDLDWRLQVLYFALLSLASAIAWRWWFKTRDRPVDHPHLNARGAALVGRKIVLEDTLHLGRGRVKIDDSLWLAISEDRTALPAGCTAEVIAFNGATLTIRDVNDETAAER